MSFEECGHRSTCRFNRFSGSVILCLFKNRRRTNWNYEREPVLLQICFMTSSAETHKLEKTAARSELGFFGLFLPCRALQDTITKPNW